MSWVLVVVAAWMGFIAGYVLCALLNFTKGDWPWEDRND